MNSSTNPIGHLVVPCLQQVPGDIVQAGDHHNSALPLFVSTEGDCDQESGLSMRKKSAIHQRTIKEEVVAPARINSQSPASASYSDVGKGDNEAYSEGEVSDSDSEDASISSDDDLDFSEIANSPVFTFHGRTYKDDDNIYIIYYPSHHHYKVNLTEYAIAKLEEMDPLIFQGLASPHDLVPDLWDEPGRHKHVLRSQPLAQLIMEGRKGRRRADLSHIFELADPVQFLRRQRSLWWIEDKDNIDPTGKEHDCRNCWSVAAIPYGAYRLKCYEISDYDGNESVGFLKEKYQLHKNRWEAEKEKLIQSRFVDQLHDVIFSVGNAEEKVQLIQNLFPPGTKPTMSELMVNLDSLVGEGFLAAKDRAISSGMNP